MTAPDLDARRAPPEPDVIVVGPQRSGAALHDIALVGIGLGAGALLVAAIVGAWRAGRSDGERSEIAAAKASRPVSPQYVISGYGGAQ